MDAEHVHALQAISSKAFDDYMNAEEAMDTAQRELDAAKLKHGEEHAAQFGVYVGQRRIWNNVMHWTVEAIEYEPVPKIYWVRFHVFGVQKLEDVLERSKPAEEIPVKT